MNWNISLSLFSLPSPTLPYLPSPPHPCYFSHLLLPSLSISFWRWQSLSPVWLLSFWLLRRLQRTTASKLCTRYFCLSVPLALYIYHRSFLCLRLLHFFFSFEDRRAVMVVDWVTKPVFLSLLPFSSFVTCTNLWPQACLPPLHPSLPSQGERRVLSPFNTPLNSDKKTGAYWNVTADITAPLSRYEQPDVEESVFQQSPKTHRRLFFFYFLLKPRTTTANEHTLLQTVYVCVCFRMCFNLLSLVYRFQLIFL